MWQNVIKMEIWKILFYNRKFYNHGDAKPKLGSAARDSPILQGIAFTSLKFRQHQLRDISPNWMLRAIPWIYYTQSCITCTHTHAFFVCLWSVMNSPCEGWRSCHQFPRHCCWLHPLPLPLPLSRHRMSHQSHCHCPGGSSNRAHQQIHHTQPKVTTVYIDFKFGDICT